LGRRIIPLVAAVLVAASTSAWSAAMRGDPGGNSLSGTARADRILGGPGGDRLSGLGGPDVIVGGSGEDRLRGGGGDDRFDGGRGADTISGGPGADRLNGGPGTDRLMGGDGRDRLEGGEGADTIICGDGEDTVVADLRDVVDADCENVTHPRAPMGSALERPFPLGVAAPTVDGWDLQVVSFVPDATASGLNDYEFSSPPPAGEVFSVVRVRATRTAPAADTFDGSFRLGAVGRAGVVDRTFESSCSGVIPDPISNDGVLTGGTIEGNVCWSMPSNQAGSLVLVDEPSTGDRLQFWAFR
jgi:Ca2+-binding RTX toxin-like protein